MQNLSPLEQGITEFENRFKSGGHFHKEVMLDHLYGSKHIGKLGELKSNMLNKLDGMEGLLKEGIGALKNVPVGNPQAKSLLERSNECLKQIEQARKVVYDFN